VKGYHAIKSKYVTFYIGCLFCFPAYSVFYTPLATYFK